MATKIGTDGAELLPDWRYWQQMAVARQREVLRLRREVAEWKFLADVALGLLLGMVVLGLIVCAVT